MVRQSLYMSLCLLVHSSSKFLTNLTSFYGEISLNVKVSYLTVTEVGYKHFEQLALWVGELLDALSEKVFLIHGKSILFSANQLPLDPSINKWRFSREFLRNDHWVKEC